MTDTFGPPEVRALVAVLPAWFATVEGLQGRRGRCVEACRVATATLRKMGVDCGALACDVDACNAGVTFGPVGAAPDTPPTASSFVLQVSCDEPSSGANYDEPRRRQGFAGHLVVVGAGWFADLTAPQFHRPEHGVVVTGAALGPYDPLELGTEMDLPAGGRLRWYWRPEVKAWRTTPAWRQDVPHAVDSLTRAIRGYLNAAKGDRRNAG